MSVTTIIVRIQHDEPMTEEARDAVSWNVQLAVTEPGDEDGDTFRPYPSVTIEQLTVETAEI